MKRGTRVVLTLDAVGVCAGDIGKVSSRTKNGWLRVTIERTHETISVRNITGEVVRCEDTKPCELRSLSPLQRLEDAATAELRTIVDAAEPINQYQMKEEPITAELMKESQAHDTIQGLGQNIQRLEEMLSERDALIAKANKKINELEQWKVTVETITHAYHMEKPLAIV